MSRARPAFKPRVSSNVTGLLVIDGRTLLGRNERWAHSGDDGSEGSLGDAVRAAVTGVVYADSIVNFPAH